MIAFQSLDEKHLSGIRKYADDKGIKIYLGTWSICPTSVSFKDKWGTAEEHLRLGLRSAKALGSPVIRVVLGNGRDRKTKGGIEARIEDTVKVLKSCKSMCKDLGVKVAMENHAGDMHSLELKTLVEEAGSDYVGVNLDAGNAVWTLETPLENLENLGKYTLTTSLRDTQVWNSENGVTAQWTAMGEGWWTGKLTSGVSQSFVPIHQFRLRRFLGSIASLHFKKRAFGNLGHWVSLRVSLPLKNGLLKGKRGRLISLLRKKMNKTIREERLNVASATVSRLDLGFKK